MSTVAAQEGEEETAGDNTEDVPQTTDDDQTKVREHVLKDLAIISVEASTKH